MKRNTTKQITKQLLAIGIDQKHIRNVSAGNWEIYIEDPQNIGTADFYAMREVENLISNSKINWSRSYHSGFGSIVYKQDKF